MSTTCQHECKCKHSDGHDDHVGTLAEKNEKFWSTVSTTVFAESWVIALQRQIAHNLTANLDWLGISTAPYTSTSTSTTTTSSSSSAAAAPRRLLDYACGNGIPSRTLAPYFNTLVGMDLSANMLSTYVATATATAADAGGGGIPDAASRFMAVQGDLMTATPAPELQAETLHGFDMAVICLALHHIEDAPLSLARLAARLRPGGVLLVIDWATQQQNMLENYNGPAAHTIAHHSFSRAQMEQAFQTAGCSDGFAFMELPEKSEVPRTRDGFMQLFFARGTKAA